MKSELGRVLIVALAIAAFCSYPLFGATGRCCYGPLTAPNCDVLEDTVCLKKTDYLAFHAGLDCTSPCPTADTTFIELRYQDPVVWAYDTDSTTKVEVWVSSNIGINAISVGFLANRRIVHVDTAYIDDNINYGQAGNFGKFALYENDKEVDRYTPGGTVKDTVPAIWFGYIYYPFERYKHLWPIDDTVLFATVELFFVHDSLFTPNPLDSWANDSVLFWLDSASFMTKAFSFTSTDGKKRLPKFGNDSTWLKKNVQVFDINPGVIPLAFELGQNYPNPFNPDTWIEFAVPNKSFVNLAIYNIMGQRVRTLVDEELEAGWKSVLWDGKDDSGNDVASGIYLYRVKSGDFVDSKKMMMLK